MPTLTQDAEFDVSAAPEREDFQSAGDFHIIDEDSANWLLRRLANIETEKARVQAQAAAMIRALDSDAARLRGLFEAELQDWTEKALAQKGNRSKTLRLLQGTCCLRTVPASVRIVSSEEAAEYAKAQGWDVVKVVETLDAAAYKQQATAALQESGEVLPGVEIVPERESFSIRFGAKSSGKATAPEGEEG